MKSRDELRPKTDSSRALRSLVERDEKSVTPWVAVCAAICAIAPALVAAAGVSPDAPASHDEGVVRTVGLGYGGIFHGPDVLVAGFARIVPVGTLALRAGLASSFVCGAAGLVLFLASRAFAVEVVPQLLPPRGGGGAAKAHDRLVTAVAAAVSLAATLSPVWQAEASAAGGDVTGALVVLAALLASQRVYDASSRPAALLLGLGLASEPLVLAGAALALAPWLARALAPADARARKGGLVDAAIAVALGASPLGVAAALGARAPVFGIAPSPFANAIADRVTPPASAVSFATAEVGSLVLVAAGAGAALATLVPDARRRLASVLGVVVVGVAAIALGAPATASRTSAAVLATTAALHVLATASAVAIVLAIARARVPFAQASAALVVVLELVLPVRAADETSARRDARLPRATSTWNEVAWGAAPPSAVLLLLDRASSRRIAAARAAGEMRDDLLVVPSLDLSSRQARRALAQEPKLLPLYRDYALGAAPEELALAQLATARPLVLTFDPRWERSLSHHLVPVGLFSRFEPEPRGVSDRRRALEAFAPSKERLVRVASPKRDADLAAATATLLRGRAIGMAATGERDVLARALDDLRPFAPEDPVANQLVRRIVTTKGPIEVKDLAP